MKSVYFLSAITLLSILTIFNVSCEKPEPEPEPPVAPVEEPVVTTAERLVGKWVHDGYYAKSRDTLLFSNEGKCFYIYSSDTTTYSYECSEQFLVFYNNNMEQYSPQPHYIKFYDDYTYFVMYNCPFFTVADVISNVGFKKVD